MAERLCGGNVGLSFLLANATATGGALTALILAFGPSGAREAGCACTTATEGLRWHAVPAYIAAQVVGAILGVWLAHIMFDLPCGSSRSTCGRRSQWVAEVATFGLLTVIWAAARIASRRRLLRSQPAPIGLPPRDPSPTRP